MIKNRKHGHIGLGSQDVDKTAKWYMDVLGMELIGTYELPGSGHATFLKGADIIYEIFPKNDMPADAYGLIDHNCFESEDIEADYKYCVEQGYKITTDGIEGIPTFLENGVRYFKIETSTGEQVEFCQVL